MKIYFCLVIIAGLLILPAVQSYSQTDTNSSKSACDNLIKNQKQSIASTINQSKALSLAENSDEFKSTQLGKRIFNNYVYYSWVEDRSTCSATAKNVNVFIAVVTGYCSAADYVFKEDPNLTSVTSLVFAGGYSDPYCPAMISPNSTIKSAIPPARSIYSNGSEESGILPLIVYASIVTVGISLGAFFVGRQIGKRV